ncbi:MAG: AI-2E family transporter [Lachnospiraceae bacterium]|jgi:predicted PurR-regulated permease PerM|nr:AI-2E family transporter [Lachnospiraceae bacterium]
MEKYIIAELVEALVVGSANFIFMLIFGMPYAVLVSVVVGITNMIPTFGPIFGAAIGGLILLLADPWKAVAFLIFTAILQTLDGYVLKPKMYGDALGVSPVMILVFIIVGGKMFGVIGILIAIPLAAILSIVISKFQAVLLERKAIRLGIDDEELVQKADEPSKE